MQGGRISRGWALAKQSFAVLRADRSLLLFPVIAMPAALAAAAIVMGPGVALYAADRQEAFLIVFGVLTLYALTFVTVFFTTALAAAAARSLGGADTTVGEGLAAARSRLGVIAAWALVQTVVGIVISAIQEAAGDSIVGRILAGLVTSRGARPRSSSSRSSRSRASVRGTRSSARSRCCAIAGARALSGPRA